jgi:hypothetical protein
MYPEQFKTLKEGIATLTRESQSLLNKTLLQLKEMATARATRKVGLYVKAGEVVIKHYQQYDNVFDSFIEKNQNLLNKIKESAAPVVKPEPVPATMPMTQKPVTQPMSQPLPSAAFKPMDPVTEVTPAPAMSDAKTNVYQQVVQPGGIPSLKVQPTPEFEEQGPSTIKSPVLNYQEKVSPVVQVAHAKFLESLEAMSNEHPVIIANYISKYASSIQDKSPALALKLFKMARSIRG